MLCGWSQNFPSIIDSALRDNFSAISDSALRENFSSIIDTALRACPYMSNRSEKMSECMDTLSSTVGIGYGNQIHFEWYPAAWPP